MTSMRTYEEIMEHVRVTPEMRNRILKTIQQADFSEPSSKTSRFSALKRLSALAACLAVVIVGALTLPAVWTPDGPEGSGVLLPSGPAEVSSAEELSRLAGFQMSDLEELPFTPEQITYSMFGEVAQIDYRSGEERLSFRKGPGTEDISGDYTSYEQKMSVEIDGVSVTFRGNDGRFYLATWSEENFSFSLSCTMGLTQIEWEPLVSQAIEPET